MRYFAITDHCLGADQLRASVTPLSRYCIELAKHSNINADTYMSLGFSDITAAYMYMAQW